MRQKTYIIGNWKMNKNRFEVKDFCDQLISLFKDFISDEDIKGSNIEIGLSPASIHLPLITNDSILSIIAQNISSEENGPFTGETSASMVSDFARYVLVGHSERRLGFNETNDILTRKMLKCHKYDLTPVFCFGESIDNREKGDYLSIIEQQLVVVSDVISKIGCFQEGVILAYEPIWAIGTGKNANSEQICEVHDFVQNYLLSTSQLKHMRPSILYGGSCNAENAKSILLQPNVHGLLIGGASLDVNHFMKIIKIAHELS